MSDQELKEEFERAAALRDQLVELRQIDIEERLKV